MNKQQFDNIVKSAQSELNGDISILKGDISVFEKFIKTSAGTVNANAISANAVFPKLLLKNSIIESLVACPYPTFTETNSEVGGVTTTTITATKILGSNNAVLVPAVVVQIGASQLAGVVGSAFKVTVTGTLANGVAFNSGIINVQLSESLANTLVIVPWNKVSDQPWPVRVSITDATPLVITVSSLQSGSATTVVVPGTVHSITQSALE